MFTFQTQNISLAKHKIKERKSTVLRYIFTTFMLYVNNEFECFIRGSKHEKTV